MADVRTVARTVLRVGGAVVLIVAGAVTVGSGVFILNSAVGFRNVSLVATFFGMFLCAVSLGGIGIGVQILFRPREVRWIVASGVALAYAGLIVLGAAWIQHDKPWAGAITGGVAVLFAAVATAWTVWTSWRRWDGGDLFVAGGQFLLLEGGCVSLATTAGLAGHTTVTWIFALAGALPLGLLLITGIVIGLRRSIERGSDAPAALQLAGLVPPVVSVVLASPRSTPIPGVRRRAACSPRPGPG